MRCRLRLEESSLPNSELVHQAIAKPRKSLPLGLQLGVPSQHAIRCQATETAALTNSWISAEALVLGHILPSIRFHSLGSRKEPRKLGFLSKMPYFSWFFELYLKLVSIKVYFFDS